MFDDYFRIAAELTEAGEPFATAIVVRAVKPTSARPGGRALVTRDGAMHGWIGGSCAQPTVIEQAMAALENGRSRLIRLSPDPESEKLEEGVIQVPMTCFSGGALDVFIEPHNPRPQLLIVGHQPVAQALAELGEAMSFRVVAVDASSLGEIATRATEGTFAVVASHGEYDEPALKAVLETPARYVGLVASRKRADAVLDLLRAEGLEDDVLSRVKAPAGLDIGARRGDEIALSIIAEIVELLRGGEGRGVAVAPSSLTSVAPSSGAREAAYRSSAGTDATEPAASADGGDAAPVDVAIDPICQMKVKVEGAIHTYDHGGVTYYFCCGGCRATFMANPDEWLAATG